MALREVGLIYMYGWSKITVFMSVTGMGDGGGASSGYLEKFHEEHVGCNLKYIFTCIYMKASFM